MPVTDHIAPGASTGISTKLNALSDETTSATVPKNMNGFNIANVAVLQCDIAYVGGQPLVPFVYDEKNATGSGTSYTFIARRLNGVSVFVNGVKQPRSSYSITGGGAAPGVANPGFEVTALASWSLGPTGVVYGTSSTNPHSPSYCAYLASNNGYIYQTATGLVVNGLYNVGVFFRNDAGATAPVLLVLHDGTGANVVTSVPMYPTINWQLLSLPYTTPSGNIGIALERGTGSGYVYFDDVTVVGSVLPGTFTITFTSAPAGGSAISVAGMIAT